VLVAVKVQHWFLGAAGLFIYSCIQHVVSNVGLVVSGTKKHKWVVGCVPGLSIVCRIAALGLGWGACISCMVAYPNTGLLYMSMVRSCYRSKAAQAGPLATPGNWPWHCAWRKFMLAPFWRVKRTLSFAGFCRSSCFSMPHASAAFWFDPKLQLGLSLFKGFCVWLNCGRNGIMAITCPATLTQLWCMLHCPFSACHQRQQQH
jgi:hypothetical protein